MRKTVSRLLTHAVAGLLGLAAHAPGQEPLAAKPAAAGGVTGEPCPCPPVEKMCVPTPGTKQVTQTVYRCKEAWYCLPRLPSLWDLFRGCVPCGPECGSPQCKRVLLKRVVTQDCPDVSCEVRDRQ
jgi:hypothetical protein